VRRGGIGGANTNASGLPYEAKVAEEVRQALISNGYKQSAKQHAFPKSEFFVKNHALLQLSFHNTFYKEFVDTLGINYKDTFSARLVPDIALINRQAKTLKIIEIKNQTGSGSVVEKLQTCDYKQYYYSKLLEKENYNVQVLWRLGKYFQDNAKALASVYEYMLIKKSPYFFDDIPMTNLLK